MTPDEHYLSTCCELALLGEGKVSPNPLVGCIIVKGRKIIGRGYHTEYGGPHAEVNALNSCTVSPKGATLYVNLEPCSHFGKTPPCADAIIHAGISRVVIGTKDPNPLVAGRGIRKLRRHGIEVTTGVLEDECAELNKFFFHHIRTGLPYVTVKIAQTVDGKIADLMGKSKWITGEESRRKVHAMRAGYDAVLTGIGTIRADNPSFTVRNAEGRNPRVVILDSLLRVRPDNNAVKPGTIIFAAKAAIEKSLKRKHLAARGAEIFFLPEYAIGFLDLRGMFSKLGEMGIISVLVEAGSELCDETLGQQFAQEMRVFIAPKLLGAGKPAVHYLNVIHLSEAQQWELRGVARSGEDCELDLRMKDSGAVRTHA